MGFNTSFTRETQVLSKLHYFHILQYLNYEHGGICVTPLSLCHNSYYLVTVRYEKVKIYITSLSFFTTGLGDKEIIQWIIHYAGVSLVVKDTSHGNYTKLCIKTFINTSMAQSSVTSHLGPYSHTASLLVLVIFMLKKSLTVTIEEVKFNCHFILCNLETVFQKINQFDRP